MDRAAFSPVQTCIPFKSVCHHWALRSLSPLGPHFEGLQHHTWMQFLSVKSGGIWYKIAHHVYMG